MSIVRWVSQLFQLFQLLRITELDAKCVAGLSSARFRVYYAKSSTTRLDRLHLGLTLLATFNPREKANLTKLTQWGIKLRTVAETPLFCRQADKLFNEAERQQVAQLATAIKAMRKEEK